MCIYIYNPTVDGRGQYPTDWHLSQGFRNLVETPLEERQAHATATCKRRLLCLFMQLYNYPEVDRIWESGVYKAYMVQR